MDRLLRGERARRLESTHGREAVVQAARDLLDDLRGRLLDGGTADTGLDAIQEALAQLLDRRMTQSLRPVINATGVVLHTNLGRAPLAREAIDCLERTAGRYVNLEFDLGSGRRGRRGAGLEDHVRAVTGADGALVVNNNAAAVLLLLRSLAEARDVVISRGELVEIGGSFRIPDVMDASGARMREVGTTNRTHASDYRDACGPETGLLWKVHPSNFRVLGFTHEVSLRDLVEIGRQAGVPVAMDLGSGLLDGERRLEGETTVRQALEAGADVVTFSGDKALGGPQAGYLVGKATWIDRCRRNPLMRALRPGRLTLAAAEATWRLYRQGRMEALPAARMLAATQEELTATATRWQASVAGTASDLEMEVRPAEGRVGGGTAPAAALPSAVLALRSRTREAGLLAADLRAHDPPVIARVQEGWLLVDPRTVAREEEPDLLAALRSLGAC